MAEARSDLGIETPWSDALAAAINPDDYDCTRDNDFSHWIDQTFGQIDPASLDLIFGVGADFWAFAHSIAFDQNARDEYIGVDGQHTQELQKRHRKGQRFWDVPTDNILLQGAHGSNLDDDAKMVPVLLSFGFPADEAQFVVDLVQQVIVDDPGHHGTPNQLEAAAAWGAELANSARPQGKIKSATTMRELFDAPLPTLLAPDAS